MKRIFLIIPIIILFTLSCYAQDLALLSVIGGGGKKAEGGSPSYATPEFVNSIDHYDGTHAEVVLASTSGNFFVFVTTGGAGTCTATTTTGSTSAWTSAGTYAAKGANICIFWATSSTTGNVGVTSGGTMSDPGQILLQFTGVAATTPQVGTIQTDAGVDGADTTVDTAAITAAIANNVLVGVWASESADRTLTMIPNNWTLPENEPNHIHKVYYKIISATGDYDFQATLDSGSENWIAGFVMFKAATL